MTRHERDPDDGGDCAVDWCVRDNEPDSDYCWECKKKYDGRGIVY